MFFLLDTESSLEALLESYAPLLDARDPALAQGKR
jgi:hypothetical protein